MAVRQIIMFDNNQAAMTHLQENYAERREIDKELGNTSTVRYFMAAFAGPNSGTMSIQYEYDSLAQLEEEQNRRFANDRWNELNAGLADAGFVPTFQGVIVETTPE